MHFSPEFWQVDDQKDNHKESQDKSLWQATFIDQEKLKDASDQEIGTCKKNIHPSTNFVSIRQRFLKHYSWERCSKHNFNFLSQNRSYGKKKDGEYQAYWKLHSHSNLDKVQPGVLFEPKYHGKAFHHQQALKS